jgi:hypothetical protein
MTQSGNSADALGAVLVAAAGGTQEVRNAIQGGSPWTSCR